jgi:hypothetical protein
VIANTAFLAAMVLLVVGFLVLDQLTFLSRYKRVLLHDYLWLIGGFVTVMFVNLVAFFYLVGRRVLLKDTGRKLAHVEKQLQTPDTIVRDLSEWLAQEE